MSDEAYEKWHKNFLADDYNWLPTAPDLTRAAWDEATRQAQAVTVERCLKAAIKAVVFYYDDAELVDQLEDSIRDALREPDPNFLARKMAEAQLEELERHANQWLPGKSLQLGDLAFYADRMAELERELTLLSQGVGGLAAMEEGKP